MVSPLSGPQSGRPPAGWEEGGPSPIGAGGPNGMKHVAIAGGSDETRLLLRGLVRLHHHKVLVEGAGPEVFAKIPGEVADPVVLLDVDLEDPRWSDSVPKAVAKLPKARFVLITPSRSAQFEGRVRALGIAAVLHRPFAVHELVEIIEPTDSAAEPPGSAPPRRQP